MVNYFFDIVCIIGILFSVLIFTYTIFSSSGYIVNFFSLDRETINIYKPLYISGPDTLLLEYNVNHPRPLKLGDIPDSVTRIRCGWSFNQSLKPGFIPNSVTYIEFGYSFNQQLNPGDIPNSVTHLTLGRDFNQLLKPGDIPNSVTHLTFGHNFEQRLFSRVIPDSVTHLAFGTNFNRSLRPGIIPNSVTRLLFGEYFNRKLKPGDIPSSVTYLEFGWSFDNILDPQVIPDSINYIRFKCPRFDYNLNSKALPDSVFVDTYKINNKWNQNNHKYFDQYYNNRYMYIRAFESRINSSILDNIPYELLCYILEY